jgi:hypothetical protein
MNDLALNVHRRALTGAGTFYTRNLDERDRRLLQSVHQCLVRSSAESQVTGMISSVIEKPYDQACRIVNFAFADMAYFGPAQLADGVFAFSNTLIRVLPRLDASARGVIVGSYLYDVGADGVIPAGLRHGGFWTSPWEGEIPDTLMADSGLLVREVNFWAFGGALAFTTNPHKLFPNGSLVVESSRCLPAPLLESVWGPAGKTGALWQTNGSSGMLAKAILTAAGLHAGPYTISAYAAAGDKFVLTTESGLVATSDLPKIGRLTPLQCLEQSAEVVMPDASGWWQNIGQLSPIAPARGIGVYLSENTIKLTSLVSPDWPVGVFKLRADLGPESDRFWAWADALQLATGNFWSARVGITGADETIYRRGFDFFLRDLGHESRMIVVVDRALTELQRSEMQRCAKLHSNHNFFINFAAP